MFQGIEQEWIDLLDPKEIREIEAKIDSQTPENRICPPKHQWFEFARLTPLDNIKVILMGQDPYHTPETAHGLAFSCLGNKIPPSLGVIYKCLVARGILREKPNHGNLTEWATRGVLLINSALSTEQGAPKSHSWIWSSYVRQLIGRISAYGTARGKTYKFLLFGNDARAFRTLAGEHEVLEWIHPSPLAQNCAPARQFINCPHFEACDIDWSITPVASARKRLLTGDISTAVNTREVEVADDLLQAFTDGSCDKNGKPDSVGGFSAIFVGGVLKGTELTGKLVTDSTNIRAEGKAIIAVLEKALETNGWARVQIYTDSDFWRKMLLYYMPKWNAEKFQSAKNPDLTTKMWALWNRIDSSKREIIWVPAHDKKGWSRSPVSYERWCYENNERADKLANEARLNL